MNYPKILNAKVLKPLLIEVLFDNNQSKVYDFTDLIKVENFSKLSDYSFFKNLKVATGGYMELNGMTKPT